MSIEFKTGAAVDNFRKEHNDIFHKFEEDFNPEDPGAWKYNLKGVDNIAEFLNKYKMSAVTLKQEEEPKKEEERVTRRAP